MSKAREIRKELARLRRQYRWECEHGFIKDKATGKDLYTICSWTAAIFAWEFGGKLVGYTHRRECMNRANDSAIVVAPGLGHDFCIVDDRWLVDFWAWTGHRLPFRERDLYDLENSRDNVIVDCLYGDRSTWQDTQEWMMKVWSLDGLGSFLGAVRRIGYPIVINNGPPLLERIAHAHRLWENKYSA